MASFSSRPSLSPNLLLVLHLCLVVFLALPDGVRAQLTGASVNPCGSIPCLSLGDVGHPPSEGRWEGHGAALGINVALGAFTGGVGQAGRGGSFVRGFLGGAGGGALGYAGKALAGRRFFGAGVLGRQVAATGSSIAANAGRGAPVLERLAFPVGFVWVHVSLGGGGPNVVRVDGPALAMTVYGVVRNDARLDLRSTLSAGAPVFRRGGREGWWGSHAGGVIFLREDMEAFGLSRHLATAAAHERIHLLQRDFTATAWGAPLDGWLLSHTRLGRAFHGRVALGSDYLLWGALEQVIGYQNRPWEHEANLLMAR